jgi:hypothetical protein
MLRDIKYFLSSSHEQRIYKIFKESTASPALDSTSITLTASLPPSLPYTNTKKTTRSPTSLQLLAQLPPTSCATTNFDFFTEPVKPQNDYIRVQNTSHAPKQSPQSRHRLPPSSQVCHVEITPIMRSPALVLLRQHQAVASAPTSSHDNFSPARDSTDLPARYCPY